MLEFHIHSFNSISDLATQTRADMPHGKVRMGICA